MSKIRGKIIRFDGFSGSLTDDNNIVYIFSNDDLISDNLKINDFVSFEPEKFTTIDNTFYVARFVKKLEK